MQQQIDENKYLLQQKGDSQTEASRKLEQFALSLSGKQKELEARNAELAELQASLHNEKERFDELNNRLNRQELRTREFETKAAN